MTNVPAMDTELSLKQVAGLHEAGCEIVRFAVRNIAEADKLGEIRTELERRGLDIPLVADIHFSPKVARRAAATAHKIRINPGNYLDRQYFLSKEKNTPFSAPSPGEIEENVLDLIDICRKNNTLIRVGVNHGSLSERIMHQYGNTAAGMVASAMEFLEICHAHDFYGLVVSMKSSHVKTMIQANLALVKEMMSRDMDYPIHLGVTEAGEGVDGRIRSAAGIGPLLSMGIGDTIRVSLTEDPREEIPVAKALTEMYSHCRNGGMAEQELPEARDNVRTDSNAFGLIGGTNPPRVVGSRSGQYKIEPDLYEKLPGMLEDGKGREYPLEVVSGNIQKGSPVLISAGNVNEAIETAKRSCEGLANTPLVIGLRYDEGNELKLTLHAASDISSLIWRGYGDAFILRNNGTFHVDLLFAILQGCGARISGTEYISCPGCGRTTFDIQRVLKQIKQHTAGLKNVKIAVMGCIVNGPGEMADADYGYVGSGRGKVTLYHAGKAVRKNIPESGALEALLGLIRETLPEYP
jgi:(E)-4-hydroxy-3-methylbut-2-enyl-diphosphate synthase